MSMVNKRLRRVTVQEELTVKGKDRQLRVMRFKFQQSQKNLDKVVKKMEKGELLDVAALKDETQNEGNFVDVYVQSIALKYPMMASRFKGMKTMDKLHLLRRIQPVLGNSPASMHEKMRK